MKMWKKHLLQRLFCSCLTILVFLFLIFSFVDISVHSSRFSKAPLSAMLNYSICHLFLQWDLFSSLSFLLACLQILFQLRQRGEAIALQTAGIGTFQLRSPFWILAIGLSLFSCLNAEWLSPTAFQQLEGFRETYAQRKKTTPREHLNVVHLEDGSDIIYHSLENNFLKDVFWIKSSDEISHFESIELGSPPKGHSVRLFEKTSQGTLYQKEFCLCSSLNVSFPASIFSPFLPFEYRSLSSLFHQLGVQNGETLPISAHFYHHCGRVLLPFFIAAFLPSVCLRYGRSFSMFPIIYLSLFVFIAYQALLEGILILAENGAISPFYGFLFPYFLAFVISFFWFSLQTSLRLNYTKVV